LQQLLVCFGKRGSKGSRKGAWKGFPKGGFWSAEGGYEMKCTCSSFNSTWLEQTTNDKRRWQPVCPVFVVQPQFSAFPPLEFSPFWHVICSFSSSVPVNVLFEYYYFYSLTPHNAGKLHKKRHKGEWNYIFFSKFFWVFGELM